MTGFMTQVVTGSTKYVLTHFGEATGYSTQAVIGWEQSIDDDIVYVRGIQQTALSKNCGVAATLIPYKLRSLPTSPLIKCSFAPKAKSTNNKRLLETLYFKHLTHSKFLERAHEYQEDLK